MSFSVPFPIVHSNSQPRFSLVFFPFPSHSHWLLPFLPAPIPVLLVVSYHITNISVHKTVQPVVKRKISTKSSKKYTSDVKASSVSWTSRVKPNTTVYNKSGLLCKNRSRLTVYDDQLPVGWKWENGEFPFPPIPNQAIPIPIPIPMKLA